MFKKPFELQGGGKIKKPAFKKLRQQIYKSLPQVQDLSDEERGLVFPTRIDAFEVVRLKGNRTAFYTFQNVPVYIDVDGTGDILPTIFGLWRVPNQLLTLYVDNGVIPNLLNGAELMAPGLFNKNVEELPEFEANQPVAISLPNSKVLAVGTTLVSSESFKKAKALKGKMVHVQHLLGDHLFLWGWTQSSSPYCNLPQELEAIGQGLHLPARANVEYDPSEQPPPASTESAEPAATPSEQEKEGEEGKEAKAEEKETEGAGEEGKEEEGEDDEDAGPERVSLSMDEILRLSFFQSIKTTLTKEDLPIIGSAFFSLHMQPNRPRGTRIDVKQSSHKKLGKFLQAMAKDGVITVKPLPKAEVQILTVNTEHPDFKNFTTFSAAGASKKKEKQAKKEESSGKKEGPGELAIKQLFKPSSELASVFTTVHEDAKKDQFYEKKEAIGILWEYTVKKELSPSGSDSVTLDPTLARGVFKKQKQEGDVVTKEELSTRFVSSLQEHFEISRDGVANIVKGKLEPIVTKEERRGGHKCVTRVKGLETFAINPKDVAKELKKLFAASATVNDIPGTKSKNNTPLQEVIVQGRMNAQVKEYLTKTYQIPRNYVELVQCK